jgi:DNA processing protein
VADAAARSAVAAGLAVISGLAAGIDTVAHESALAAGGLTWAVLGSGVDVPTPISNAALAEEIVARGGGLIAEVPLGTPVGRQQLVARDRIQSGLSLAVVICQCETSSGAMHTARFAVVQGRLLVVVRPRGPDGAVTACSGNVALADPNGCDPALLSATGRTAAHGRRGDRRPGGARRAL